MGYFKRPIRRSTARRARRSLVEPAREIPARGWQRCDDDIVPAPDTFLRSTPGRIYRDDYQVAAVPYRDRRMTSSTL
jgi:hypothetical protein